MITQPYSISIRRLDPSKNMARFYRITIEQSLFGDVLLVKSWGRIGTRGRAKVYEFANDGQAVEEFLRTLSSKRRRGYVVWGGPALPGMLEAKA
jgi:predicted DNA-binding WGR domain protein